MNEMIIKPKKKRIEYLDSVKGITRLLIILVHTSVLVGGHPANYWLLCTENFRIPVYWIAAGYTSRVNFSLRRNFKRIIIPYFILSAISLIFCAIFTPSKISWGAVLGIFYSRSSLYPDFSQPHILYMTNGPLWFLTSFFTGYVVYKGILWFETTRNRLIVSLVSLGIAFAMRSLPILLPWSIDLAFFVAPMMYAGHLMRKYEVIERATFPIALLVAVIYGILAWFTGPIDMFIRDYGTSLFSEFGAGLTGTFLMFYIFHKLKGSWINKVLAKIDTQALWIYGMQVIFIYLSYRFAAKIGLPGLVSILFQLSVTTIGGYICGLIYNKTLGPRL